jgi:hypothetical protein
MPPSGWAFEKTAHRRVRTERLDELDPGVRQIDEHDRDTVRRQGTRRRDAGAERALVEPARRCEIRDDDGHMIEPSDHLPA